MKRIIPAKILNYTRTLRKSANPWETKLWYYLRAHRFMGLKFKRQVQIGNTIADFSCNELKLVIELDGGQHSETNQAYKDLAKDKFLAKEGYTVLRFWNNELDENMEGVLEKIRLTAEALSPSPSPQRGRGARTLVVSPQKERGVPNPRIYA